MSRLKRAIDTFHVNHDQVELIDAFVSIVRDTEGDFDDSWIQGDSELLEFLSAVHHVRLEDKDVLERRFTSDTLRNHESHFSTGKFWKKVNSAFGQIGRELLERAISLYYSGTSEKTPAWAKVLILGALGYLIVPVDSIPDFVIGTGYVDDAMAIGAATAAAGTYITESAKHRAKDAVRELTGTE